MAKLLKADLIVSVSGESKCEVVNASGVTTIRFYDPETMDDRRPEAGRYWAIYDDGTQRIVDGP